MALPVCWLKAPLTVRLPVPASVPLLMANCGVVNWLLIVSTPVGPPARMSEPLLVKVLSVAFAVAIPAS